MALLGAGLGGCATRHSTHPASGVQPLHSRVELVPVQVSWDRVIRTTIGLRPHRPSGFVLKAEKLDDRTVIHNFGHGGAGVSLSWGTASMAADLALAHDDRRAAVLGCGVVGLTSARELQRRGFTVTISASTVPPDTTSNMSLAGFMPTSGLVMRANRTPEWEEQFRRAVDIAYRRLQLLVGPRYRISWLNTYTPTEDERMVQGRNILLPDHVQGSQVLLKPGEHPFPTEFAIERPGMRIEPSIYLDTLMRDVMLFGGHIVIRKFETPRDVMALDEAVIVNCTGLGSKALFNDPELVPLKGQLCVLVPQAEVTYGTNGGLRSATAEPGIGIHMMPRTDGIILGGTSERDVWTMDVNEPERKRVVEGHMDLLASLRAPAGGPPMRVEQPRIAPPVGDFFDLPP
jgi:D-amino-acid oxidase